MISGCAILPFSLQSKLCHVFFCSSWDMSVVVYEEGTGGAKSGTADDFYFFGINA